jgi:hypothetical protein
MKHLSKFSTLLIALSIGFFSCSSPQEEMLLELDQVEKEPTLDEALATWDQLDKEANTSTNFRKDFVANYFEITENQLFFIPGEGYVGGPAPGFYPGTGAGLATRIGKASSFINQFASFDGKNLVTVGAPVTAVFGAQLSGLGLSGIPNEVSSLTTDGKGNAIWFKNIKNTVTPVREDLSMFVAEVEVIGGNGRFKKLSGLGVVRGNFNPLTGKGVSVSLIQIEK